MSVFSRLFSGPINWDTADTGQKLAALAELPPGDPVIGQLALNEADAGVRHAAIVRMDAAAQLRLAAAIRAGDEDCLAAGLAQQIGDAGLALDDALAQLAQAPVALRLALIAHTKSEPLALALTETLDRDADRANIARGKGAIEARIAAVRGMQDLELLEAIAHDYRDKQRGIYRAARDRADQLLAAREVLRRALALCERLDGLFARGELTLTAFTLAEREWAALAPTPAPPSYLPTSDADALAALQTRYAALRERAHALLQQQAGTLREAERLKAALAELAIRSDAPEAVEPDACAALVAEREATEQKLALASLDALPKEHKQLAEAIAKLAERHALLGIESKALVEARRLAADLRNDPAVLTPDWRAEFARSVALVRPALRAPIEEAATAARAVIDAVARKQIEAERAVEQEHRAQVEALLKQLEQLLDKGQHAQANEAIAAIKAKRAETPGARPLPAALEFRLKRCQDRLAKMNEWKRVGDMKAREALCREAEVLAKRVNRHPKPETAEGTPEAAENTPAAAEDAPAAAENTLAAAEDAPAAPVPALTEEGTAASAATVAEPAAAAPAAEPAAEPTADPAPQTEAIEPAAAAEAAPAEASHAETWHSEAPPEEPVTAESLSGPDTPQTADDAAASPESGDTPGEQAADAAVSVKADEPPLAPDAIAAAVRDMQARWQALDKTQGPASKGLHGRFRRACDRAYAPAKKHFEQLEKQRSANAEKKTAVLEQLAALSERIVDGADWGKVLNERGERVKAWFAAGPLPRRDVRAMQKRFDAVTGAIDKKLDARRETERARRRALIEQAKAIAERPAEGGSIAAMIALQKQWQDGIKGTIRLKPREDQTLWEAFRAAGNALFGKRDAEKASRAGERESQLAGRRALIDEMQALAALDDAAAIRRGVEDIAARWHAMEWPERKPLREWEHKFSAARADATARIAAIRGEAEKRVHAAAAARLAVMERAEQALGKGSTPDMDAVRAELQTMLGEGEKPDARVMARLAALEAAVKAGPDAWRTQVEKTRTERDALLLELEIVLGLPSPPELEAARRMRMLKRLAESKNSRSTPPLAAPDAPKAVEKLLALPLAMQDAQARVEAVVEAARRKGK